MAEPRLIEARPEDAVATDERIRADLARLLQDRLVRESRLGVWVHPFLIAVIARLAWPVAPHSLLVGWVAAVLLTAATRAAWLFVATRGTRTARAVRTGVRITVTLLALAWGVGGALVLPLVPVETTALILVVLAGIIASALTTLAADPLSLRGFLAGIALPVFAALAISERSNDLAAAVVVAIFTLGMAIVARRAHITLVEHLRVTARLAISEEAAKRAEAVMRDARDLAERVAHARSTFLANMSHEIRTPMNAVLGFVELILDTELSVEQRRALELVRSSSEALLMILNDILDYSKIEAEHLELESIPFDLSKVVHATASLLAVRAREKHLELLAEVAPDVPRAVRGDPTRLRQVLMNLIGNAVKFTEEGEVVVSVNASIREGQAQVRFAVRDTGIGIAPENLASVFQEFTQADSTMTRRYGGTGLGLAISQRLVRLMGGQLAVESAIGTGSVFSFTLPFPVEEAPHRPTGVATLTGRRMLIVDDNQSNRRILREMLGAEGVAVDEAATATEGLDAIRRAVQRKTPYDLAILDVQMPDMDGFTLAEAVRKEKAIKRTNLLMLTSAGQRGDGERCRALGIRGYLTKPMSRADLLEALGAVLAESERTETPEVVTRHTIAESRRTLRVLLAEDNAVNQQVAVAMLVKRGHEVHVTGNGREALEAVRQRDYDVVLMDIQMPEMDGFEATAAIRALDKGKTLPIIGLTAHALSGERERCLARGMTEYLAKPFKAHELFALVEASADGAAPRPTIAARSAGPPVDLEGFRATLREAGAEQALYSIVDTFVRQGPDRLAGLAAAATSNDGPEMAKAAHLFRGAAATIGARELAGLLERLETAARAGEVAAARELFDVVSPVAHEVVEYLRQQQSSITEA
ncbi:MAG TPA: response regulator [Gemmatimonadales bacterium]|nr:response regulator [Gemmatimonadales bacterium]